MVRKPPLEHLGQIKHHLPSKDQQDLKGLKTPVRQRHLVTPVSDFSFARSVFGCGVVIWSKYILYLADM